MKATSPVDAGKRRTTLLLAGLAVGMFAFGFALVPLYNLICQATGLSPLLFAATAAPVPFGPVAPLWITRVRW